MKKSKQNFRSIWMKYQTVIIFAVMIVAYSLI